jgi:hypothetical protein
MQFALERIERMKRDKAQLEVELKPYKDKVLWLGKPYSHGGNSATEERIRVIEREIATVDHFLRAAIRDTPGMGPQA